MRRIAEVRFSEVVLLVAALIAPAVALSDAPARAVQAFEAGDNAAAERLLLDAQSHRPDDLQVLYYLGRTQHRRHEWKAAVTSLEHLVELNAKNGEYQFRLGLTLSRYIETVGVLGKPAVAERIREALKRGVALNPDFIDGREALLKYYLAAPGFLGGSVDKAREQAQEVAKRNIAEGHYSEGLIDEHEDRAEAAVDDFKAAVSAAPDDPSMRVEFGQLCERLQRYDEAFDIFETAIRRDPKNMPALYGIGETAVLSGRQHDRGVEALKLYLHYVPVQDDDPPLSMAHLQLGMLYEKNKQNDLAHDEYQAALALDPDLDQARKAMHALN